MEKSNSPPPHLAGRSLTLRVGFYLPERCRDCEMTGPRDSCTPKHSPSLCGSPRAHQTPKKAPRRPSHLVGLITPPLKKRLAPSRCGSFSPLAGRFLPTRAPSGLRDYGTERPRDDETAALQGNPAPPILRVFSRVPTPKTPRPFHFAGLPARANPQNATPLTLRVIFRTLPQKNTLAPPILRVVSHVAGTKNSTLASKSSFRRA